MVRTRTYLLDDTRSALAHWLSLVLKIKKFENLKISIFKYLNICELGKMVDFNVFTVVML